MDSNTAYHFSRLLQPHPTSATVRESLKWNGIECVRRGGVQRRKKREKNFRASWNSNRNATPGHAARSYYVPRASNFTPSSPSLISTRRLFPSLFFITPRKSIPRRKQLLFLAEETRRKSIRVPGNHTPPLLSAPLLLPHEAIIRRIDAEDLAAEHVIVESVGLIETLIGWRQTTGCEPLMVARSMRDPREPWPATVYF